MRTVASDTSSCLIVDDSKAMRMIVSRVLRQAGYGHAEFVEGSNGVEGLAAARAGDIDLVLSDWNMPEMNGIEFLLRLRAGGSDVRFGFVTSESTADMREQAVLAGALTMVPPAAVADTLRKGDVSESLVARPEFRRDFAVQIDGYGAGRLSLLVN
jgi:two-component system chemotaxis response regulator CheY